MVHHKTKIIEWKVPEATFRHKRPDWYWGVGIATVVGVVLSIIFSNYLLGFLILLGGVLIGIHSSKEPNIMRVELSDQGIKLDNQLYPFTNINAFWIKVYEDENSDIPAKLLFHTERWLTPLVAVPIPYELDIELEHLREILLDYLPEHQMDEPALTKLTEKIGF